MSEKLRIQREVGMRFVQLLGLADGQIKFVDEHPDAGGPDALVTFKGLEKIVEMTRADPEGSGALIAPRGERGYLSGAVRGPLHKLWKSFHALSADDRCFDLFICFHSDRIPQGQACEAFFAELTEVMRLVKGGEFDCDNYYWSRKRWVLRPPYGGRTL